MGLQKESRLLSRINAASSRQAIIELFRLAQIEVSSEIAEHVLAHRATLPNDRFTSLTDVEIVPGIVREWFVEVLDVLVSEPATDVPVLLFPLRLETRFDGSDLLVRIYPDQIQVSTHESLLTQTEADAGVRYWAAVNETDSDEDHRSAWRELARLFGPNRAAWISRVIGDLDGQEPEQLKDEEEGWFTVPRAVALPDRFAVYLYREGELVDSVIGNDITPGLTMLGHPSTSDSGMFDENSRWMVDFENALQKGMAIRVDGLGQNDPSLGFSRVVVVGIKEGNPEDGRQELVDLLDRHHYSTGLGFLSTGTPTNNTMEVQSGYSQSSEDRETSFAVELLGPPRWEEVPLEPRTKAQRLGHALGLGLTPEALRYVAGAGDTEDAYAKEMQTALWPATGDYLLRHLLSGVVSDADLVNLGHHFANYVRADGPLPPIRVRNQPYGVLPVASVNGWTPSVRDSQDGATDDSLTLDIGLHRVLSALFAKWLAWTEDHNRVPRVRFDLTEDPDEDLLRILAMEPISLAYRARPYVDERLVAWLLVAMRDYAFGADTPYGEFGGTALSWVSKWAEQWDEIRDEEADQWHELTGADRPTLRESDLLKLLGWWNAIDLHEDLEVPLVSSVTEAALDVPTTYLNALCAAADSDSATLLNDLLSRSLDLADASCFSEAVIRNAICALAQSSVLDFFNSVTDPNQIVQRIRDDPDFGSGSPRAYGVRPTLAQRIIDTRDALPGGRYTSIDQIDSIFGVGEDTLHDILHAFIDEKVTLDLGRLLRGMLDLCTHRLDAWITSLATKRLWAMREEQPQGIHLGAYGCVEDLRVAGPADSAGFIHAASRGQAAAGAVLHNAYLTHANGTTVNPFRISLTSDRVRRALRITEGIRQGQSLGALLGYQFERGLHERHMDRYIDDFRNAFPLVAHKETEPEEEDSTEASAARNVIDGVALVRWWRDAASEEIDGLSNALNEADVETELNRLNDTLDAVSDTLMFESVYQAVQGNFERGGAALEAAAGNVLPPEMESVTTPFSGKTLSHRVCLLLDDAAAPASGTPRARAEPRVAAWFVDLVGVGLDAIGFGFAFDSPRWNVNEASAAELAALPDLGETECEAIVAYRDEHGPFSSIDDLAGVPGIAAAGVESARRWAMTGFEESEADKRFERININDAPAEDLELLPSIGPIIAQSITQSRETELFDRIGDLVPRVPGIGPGIIEDIRPFVTATTTMHFGELGIDAIDLLYLATSPLHGEETEIEQRIGYAVREEHALPSDVKIVVDPSRQNGYRYGLREAIEIGRKALDLLAGGSVLRPASLCTAAAADELSFSAEDVDNLNLRILDTLASCCQLGVQLGGEPIQDIDGQVLCDSSEIVVAGSSGEMIPLLFEASLYGILGVLPAGPNDPETAARAEIAIAEMGKRVAACQKLRAEALLSDPPLGPERQVRLLVDAYKTLFGRAFVVLPTFVPATETHFRDALSQTGLLAGLGSERVRLWLQQAACVHSPLESIEDLLIYGEAWRQSTDRAGEQVLNLRVAQLPFDAENLWLALDDEERGFEVNADPDSARGFLSIVAATNTGEGEVLPTRLAGLLIHQWDEMIPTDSVDTSVSFHYNAPNAQAPQSMLLVVPDQRGNESEPWTLDAVASTVKDVFDLARIRAVDLDAMGELDGDEPDDFGAGVILPALMFPTDPGRPGWAREAFADSIEEFVEALTEEPRSCADLPGFIAGEGLGPKFDSLGMQLVSLGDDPPLAFSAGNHIVFPPEGIRLTWALGSLGELTIMINPIGWSRDPVPSITAFDSDDNVVASGFQSSPGGNREFNIDLDRAVQVEIAGGYDDETLNHVYSVHSMCVRDVLQTSEIVEGAVFGPFVVRAVILTGAISGNYTFRQDDNLVGLVRLLHNDTEVMQLSYDWQTTISYDNPYRFSFDGYFDIDIGHAGPETRNMYGLKYHLFDGQQVLHVEPP